MGGRQRGRNPARKSSRDNYRSRFILFDGFPAAQVESRVYHPAQNPITRDVHHYQPPPRTRPRFTCQMGTGDLETSFNCLHSRSWIAVGDYWRCSTRSLHSASPWLGVSCVLIPVIWNSRDNILLPLPDIEYPRSNVSAATRAGPGTVVVAFLPRDWSRRLSTVREIHLVHFRDRYSACLFLPSHGRV